MKFDIVAVIRADEAGVQNRQMRRGGGRRKVGQEAAANRSRSRCSFRAGWAAGLWW